MSHKFQIQTGILFNEKYALCKTNKIKLDILMIKRGTNVHHFYVSSSQTLIIHILPKNLQINIVCIHIQNYNYSIIGFKCMCVCTHKH